MASERDAEIEVIKLKIDNLLVAANYQGLPQAANGLLFQRSAGFETPATRIGWRQAGSVAARSSVHQNRGGSSTISAPCARSTATPISTSTMSFAVAPSMTRP